MVQPQGDTKLVEFEQAIMRKAQAEKAQILEETEAAKKAALEEEENRLLEEQYRKIQQQISEIRVQNIKTVSQETLQMKKELYRQREQYLSEMIARARAELAEFVRADGYEAYFMGKVRELAEGYRFEGSTIKVRKEDLVFASKIREIYGACEIEADDDRIAVGGPVLLNAAQGVEVDLSLDAALAEQRDWFYANSSFKFE